MAPRGRTVDLPAIAMRSGMYLLVALPRVVLHCVRRFRCIICPVSCFELDAITLTVGS